MSCDLVTYRTDEIIQRAIRENFSECTVVTIAHRLNTIMDSDRILVGGRGQAVGGVSIDSMLCCHAADEQWSDQGV